MSDKSINTPLGNTLVKETFKKKLNSVAVWAI